MYDDISKEEHWNLTRGASQRFKQYLKGNLYIDINKQLAYDAGTEKSKVGLQLVKAIASGSPCILYSDSKHWALIIPKLKAIVRFYPGDKHTVEILDDLKFQNQVKYLYVVFSKFEYPTKKIVGNVLQMLLKNFTPQLQNPV